MKQPPSSIQQPIPTVLVSRPGIMRQSLQVSLATYPGILVVSVCGDGLTALSHVAQHRPRMLIIDSNLLNEEVDALITSVKTEWPAIFCLVILHSSQREEPTLASGADAIIQRDRWVQDAPTVLQKLWQRLVDPDY